MGTSVQTSIIIPPPSGVSGGILDSHFPSVWRRYGFRSVTQVFMEFKFQIHMHIFVATGRSLSILKDITFKMAAWQPYWIFRFPDSNFSLALNTQSKLHLHITCVCGKMRIDFQQCYIQIDRLAAISDFSVSGLCGWHGFCNVIWVWFRSSISNFICCLRPWAKTNWFSDMWISKGSLVGYIGLFIFRTVTSVSLWTLNPLKHITCV